MDGGLPERHVRSSQGASDVETPPPQSCFGLQGQGGPGRGAQRSALAELAKRFDGHPGQIIAWKDQLLTGAVGVFSIGGQPAEPPVDVKTLHATIGELALENDSLERALSKAGLLTQS